MFLPLNLDLDSVWHLLDKLEMSIRHRHQSVVVDAHSRSFDHLIRSHSASLTLLILALTAPNSPHSASHPIYS